MTLFLIVGIPVFFIAVLNMFFSGYFYVREVLAPLGKGVLWFFPFCLVYALFSDLVPIVYGGLGFYFSRTLIDLGAPLFFCTLACLFSRRKSRGDGKELFILVAAFFTGFFMLFAQYVRIIFPDWYGEYMYFLLPLLWMSLILWTGLLLALFFSGPGAGRFLFLLILAALPFCMGGVPYLYAMNYRIFAWLLTLFFFSVSLFLLRRTPLK